MVSLISILFMLFWLLLSAGACVLQVYLSRKKSKVVGLILPAAFLIVSVMVVILNALPASRYGLSAGAFAALLFLFLFLNIPTVVLLLLYKNGRETQKKNKELEKMNIQDL